MDKQQTKLQIFNDTKIRTAWNSEEEEWYFSVVDVVAMLTENKHYQASRKYWNKLKQRLGEERSELVTFCHRLKMPAADGKMKETDGMERRHKSCANFDGPFRDRREI